jgi:hypothetical protein
LKGAGHDRERPGVGPMIVPDAKDWTWVLDRKCPVCGFDTSTWALTEIPELVRRSASRWEQLLAEVTTYPGSATADRYKVQEPTVVVDRLALAAGVMAVG